MKHTDVVQIERNIAWSRLMLSIAGPVTVYLDPTQPELIPGVTTGAFFIHPHQLAVLLAHLAYSSLAYAALATGAMKPRRVTAICTWADVLFGAAIALVTEGTNSPFYIYFAFAVMAAGLRGSFRTALAVTAASVGLYLAIILIVHPEGVEFYVVRGVSLAVTGYLVGSLGRERAVLESHLLDVARSLHDGYAQTLAGVTLRIDACRELLRRGRSDETYAELGDLLTGVRLEHDELRTFVRSLLNLEASPPPPMDGSTRVSVQATFAGPLRVVEHALQIMLEGVRNVGRHAHAGGATVSAGYDGAIVRIRIDDDGRGFAPGAALPWSIASRAAELGGSARIVDDDGGAGGRVLVELPVG